MAALDHLSHLFHGFGPERYDYHGRALVMLDRMSLLDLDQAGLPNMLGQLDVQPGLYEVRLSFVRRVDLRTPRALQRNDG